MSQILIEEKGMCEDFRLANNVVVNPIPLPTLNPEPMPKDPEYMFKEDICDLFRIGKSI